MGVLWSVYCEAGFFFRKLIALYRYGIVSHWNRYSEILPLRQFEKSVFLDAFPMLLHIIFLSLLLSLFISSSSSSSSSPFFHSYWRFGAFPMKQYVLKFYKYDTQIAVNMTLNLGAEWRIYASVNHTIIGSNNGLSPVRWQSVIWTNYGLLLIRPQRKIFNNILFEMKKLSFKKMHMQMSSAKMVAILSRPQCVNCHWISFCPSSLSNNNNNT